MNEQQILFKLSDEEIEELKAIGKDIGHVRVSEPKDLAALIVKEYIRERRYWESKND